LPPDPIYQAKIANSYLHAEDVFELLNCKNYLRLDRVLHIRKQRALEEAKEPQPETKERTMKVLKSTDRLGLTDAGSKIFRTVIIMSSEQQQSEKEL
jgi:hypothetical protein